MILSSGCSSSVDDDKEPAYENIYEVKFSIFFEGSWSLKSDDKGNEDLKPYVGDYMKKGIGRHIFRIYKANEVSTGTIPVVSYEFEISLEEGSYDFSIYASLPEGDYIVKTWTDFRETSESIPYYDVSKFPNVSLDHHSVLTGFQDAYRGSQSFRVDKDTSSVEIIMERPLGRYLLICEDYMDLLKENCFEEDDIRIFVFYTGFYPHSYSVINDRLIDSITGEYFIISPVVLSDGSAIVAADFFLINELVSSVGLELKMVNKENKVVAASEVITLPITRNEITIAKGILLKMSSGEQGSFDMDTGFEGDFIIKY